MAKVITVQDAEELQRKGEQPPAGSILTPSARDLLYGGRAGKTTAAAPAAASKGPSTPKTPDLEYRWKPGADAKSPAEIEKFFHAADMQVLKERICDIGRRLWVREYTDGNGGNITVRVGDNLALCTPTLICKGFMKPEDICLVDLDGKQLAGSRVRTSEAMTHFGIMKRQPAAKSCVHAHPPHATAFAISNVDSPSCLIPEAEVFLGKIGVATYKTPGSKENADEVGEVGKIHQAVLMENHGVICWGKDVEDAYWKMENIDSYCRTIGFAASLGGGLHRFTGGQAKELIKIREKLGMSDPRSGLKECELCDNADFRPAVTCLPADAEGDTAKSDPSVEALVQQITEQLMKQIGKK